ncbi:hypothetical protein AB1Y20_004354 [Prymnesium parvum]|uniref:Anaphase-promoting complex subunit 11 n=1 Tax=Prymnesium parvum TaxID=97485 RepID=A0AB34IW37_PRYPA
MRRERPFLPKPTDALQATMNAASRARLFVVQEPGPTSFVLKSEASERQHRVSIGSVHSCSCGARSQPCVHTAFVLLRVFRLPPSDTRAWQSSLIDSELEALVDARARSAALQRAQVREAAMPPACGVKASGVARRPVTEDEVEPCPICYEDLTPEDDEARLLDWCSLGCGKSLHRRCFTMWADHQKSIGKNLTCPFCRTEWVSGPLLPAQPPPVGERGSHHHRVQDRPAVHRNAQCGSCRASPIFGPRHRCLVCPAKFELCSDCYGSGMHQHHPFAARERPGAPWTVGEDRSVPSLQPASISRDSSEDAATAQRIAELQHREIGPEDYDLLLALGQFSGDLSQLIAPPRPPHPMTRTPQQQLHELQQQERHLQRQLHHHELRPQRQAVELEREALEALVAALNEREAQVAARNKAKQPLPTGEASRAVACHAPFGKRRSAPFGSSVPRWHRQGSAPSESQEGEVDVAGLCLGGHRFGPSLPTEAPQSCGVPNDTVCPAYCRRGRSEAGSARIDVNASARQELGQRPRPTHPPKPQVPRSACAGSGAGTAQLDSSTQIEAISTRALQGHPGDRSGVCGNQGGARIAHRRQLPSSLTANGARSCSAASRNQLGDQRSESGTARNLSAPLVDHSLGGLIGISCGASRG